MSLFMPRSAGTFEVSLRIRFAWGIAVANSFPGGYFNLFAFHGMRVAAFEVRVKNISGKTGFIDLPRKGVLLFEQKSGSQNKSHY